jgi:hypothetical protein
MIDNLYRNSARHDVVPLRDTAPELRLVHERLDSWSGIGLIAVGCTARATTCS